MFKNNKNYELIESFDGCLISNLADDSVNSQ